MKPALQISLRRAATATFLLSCFLMNSQDTVSNNHVKQKQDIAKNDAGARTLGMGLVTFSAVPAEGQVNITWTTASEKDNDYFIVERSVDGLNWETMTTLDAVGSSGSANYYNCIDPLPYAEGFSYYRLKETHFNGDYFYSDIQVVEMQTRTGKIQLYPNPSVSHVKIIPDNETTTGYTVSFYNMSGQLVKHITGDINTLLIDVNDLEAGSYVAVIDSGTKLSKVQFVKN